MTTLFEFHVFAHKDGRYQTTQASVGVAALERRELEQFFFGQTNDVEYLKSLRRDPGVIWRRVGTRFALTRVLNGKKDPEGRATLRFETVLVPPEMYDNSVRLAELVRSEWRLGRDRVSFAVASDVHAHELHRDTVSEIVLSVRNSERLVRKSTGVSLDDVEKIVSLCRDDPEFSLCYKSLNERAPVSVNLVFGDVAERRAMPKRSVTHRVSTGPLPHAATRARSATDVVMLGVACLVLLLQVVILLRPAAQGGAPSAPATMQETIIKHIKAGGEDLSDGVDDLKAMVEKVSQQLESKLRTTNETLKRLEDTVVDKDTFESRSSKLAEQVTDLQDRETEAKKKLDKLSLDSSETFNLMFDSKKQLGTLEEKVDSVAEQLGTWAKQVTKIGSDVVAIKKELYEYTGKEYRENSEGADN